MEKWDFTILLAQNGRIMKRDYYALPRDEETDLIKYLKWLGENGWKVIGYQRSENGIESIMLQRLLKKTMGKKKKAAAKV